MAQSVCVLLPEEYHQRVIDLRADLSEDPALGAIYDPPFVHFTVQLAPEYDWEGLAVGLAAFARSEKPFAVNTSGLLAFTGGDTGIAISVRRDAALVDFHARAWDVVSKYAQGDPVPFYHPDRWVPHVTIKRCGANPESFGRAMARLGRESFAWTMTVDNIAVQHDPGTNSLTHYLRLRYPLG